MGVCLEGERDCRRSDWLGVLCGVRTVACGELISSKKIRGDIVLPLAEGGSFVGGDIGGVIVDKLVARLDVGVVSAPAGDTRVAPDASRFCVRVSGDKSRVASRISCLGVSEEVTSTGGKTGLSCRWEDEAPGSKYPGECVRGGSTVIAGDWE